MDDVGDLLLVASLQYHTRPDRDKNNMIVCVISLTRDMDVTCRIPNARQI